ncbi:MAG: CoA transferase [Gammaproteobacteria bacterium]|nr:CoA transferase [Gammaproteobacteria bacterium]
MLIESLAPGRLAALGLGYDRLRQANPALVLTSITAFGQSGPHRDFPAADIVAMAMGGAMVVTGDPADPPVTLAGSQACVSASTLAAAGSLIALRHAALTGQGQHVDISMQEAVLAVTSICGARKWLDDGTVPKRFGTGTFSSVPSGTYPCIDGEIYLMVNRPLHWKALARWVHGPRATRRSSTRCSRILVAAPALPRAAGHLHPRAHRAPPRSRNSTARASVAISR